MRIKQKQIFAVVIDSADSAIAAGLNDNLYY